MSILIEVIISAAIGAAVGFFHFGLLWITVSRIETARRPALMMAAGTLVRFALFFAGFVAAALTGGIKGVLAALAALLVVRTVMVGRVRRSAGGGAEGPGRGKER